MLRLGDVILQKSNVNKVVVPTIKEHCGDNVLKEGDSVSLDGNTGNVYTGEVELETEYPDSLLSEIQKWKTVRN